MERDDLIVNDSYAINNSHTNEEGKAIRKIVQCHCFIDSDYNHRGVHGRFLQTQWHNHLGNHQIGIHCFDFG